MNENWDLHTDDEEVNVPWWAVFLGCTSIGMALGGILGAAIFMAGR